ncbi:MAG: thioredoxin family protein [Sulfurimonadaceae bacterium]
MKYIRSIFAFILLTQAVAMAGTIFTLTGIKKVYPDVEIGGKKIPKTEKSNILALLKETTDELGIDTSGHDSRSLTLLIGEMYVGKEVVINVRLLIGEQVKRLDSGEKSFAITYGDREYFTFDDGYEDQLEDALDSLFERFSKQYREENSAILKVSTNEQGFALAMGYETNYDTALKRAKKEKKNIMLVLVTNYCPWCRKFEERVLMKKEVNVIIQKSYIPLIINKDRDLFPKRFDNAFTPIVHFIDYKTEQSYESVVGYNNRDEFLYLLKKDSSK